MEEVAAGCRVVDFDEEGEVVPEGGEGEGNFVDFVGCLFGF